MVGNRLNWIVGLMLVLWAGRAKGFDNSLSVRVFEVEQIVRARIVLREKVTVAVSGSVRGYVVNKLTLEVLETIRGTPATSLEVYDDSLSKSAWMERSGEQLFFLQKGSETHFWPYLHVPWAISNWSAPIPLEEVSTGETQPEGVIFTDDLRRLSDAQAILEEMRRLALSGWASRRIVIVAPNNVWQKVWGYDVQIALTPPAFAMAREWAVSKDVQRRWDAARMLRENYSPENVEALRKIINMPVNPTAKWDAMKGMFARTVALSALAQWGEGGLPAVIESTRSGRDAAIGGIWATMNVLCCVWAMATWKNRKIRRVNLNVLWCVLLLSTIGLAIRSYKSMDAMAWGNMDVALVGGDLYFTHHMRQDVTIDVPLTICRPVDLVGFNSKENWGFTGTGIWKFAKLPRFPAFPWSPEWTDYASVRVPIWVFGVLLVMPRCGIWLWRCWRAVRLKEKRGFPVEIVDGAPGGPRLLSHEYHGRRLDDVWRLQGFYACLA